MNLSSASRLALVSIFTFLLLVFFFLSNSLIACCLHLTILEDSELKKSSRFFNQLKSPIY